LFTAPLTVVFARQAFGMAELGAISGSIFMIHHASGGLGALLGGFLFDATGNYTNVFWVMAATSTVACAMALILSRMHLR
jgi:cyanate permease